MSGCSVKGGSMAPVEDRTGGASSNTNYGHQVVPTEGSSPAPSEAKTQAYVAPPSTSPVSAPPAKPAGEPDYQPAKTNPAVTSLVSIADAKIKSGQYNEAAASLERALRHDSKNPDTWARLADVRLLQQDYAQAETTALKSNALSGGNKALMSKNWRLISKSRRLRGDSVGADEAEVRAYQLTK
jgi:tetratricopeptide (TPR) repeat protein